MLAVIGFLGSEAVMWMMTEGARRWRDDAVVDGDERARDERRVRKCDAI